MIFLHMVISQVGIPKLLLHVPFITMNVGVETFVVSSKQSFQMHDALFRTINDYPTYGDISGWNTKVALTCPLYNYDS